VDFHFTAEEEAFRRELQDWLAEHLVGEFTAHAGAGGPADNSHWDLRRAWERELVAGGWLGITWPTEYGGRGGTLNQELIFQYEHAAAGAPYWVGVQGRDLFAPTLLRFGSDEQKARWLPPIMAVDEFWGQGFSEPDAGSDLASLQTRAVRDGDQWVVDGQKIWMTFGTYADWLYVLCRTNPDAPKHKGISLLVIDRHQAGVDVRPIRNIADGLEFAEVFLTGARTPLDHVIGPVDAGWSVAMGALGFERATTLLPYQGVFQREMEELTALVRRRGRSGDPILRQRLAGAYIGLQIMRYSTFRMLTGLLRNGELGSESSVSKLYWANWHRDFGELLVDVLGTEGLLTGDDYDLSPFQRSFLNSRAETIYGGANEIQRNIVGERVLGLPRGPQ
jgi:alkylation response protein AidB-like acyl-CoA dehydrogenase